MANPTYFITFKTETGVRTTPIKGCANQAEAIAAFENLPEYEENGRVAYWRGETITGTVDVVAW